MLAQGDIKTGTFQSSFCLQKCCLVCAPTGASIETSLSKTRHPQQQQQPLDSNSILIATGTDDNGTEQQQLQSSTPFTQQLQFTDPHDRGRHTAQQTLRQPNQSLPNATTPPAAVAGHKHTVSEPAATAATAATAAACEANAGDVAVRSHSWWPGWFGGTHSRPPPVRASGSFCDSYGRHSSGGFSLHQNSSGMLSDAEKGLSVAHGSGRKHR